MVQSLLGGGPVPWEAQSCGGACIWQKLVLGAGLPSEFVQLLQLLRAHVDSTRRVCELAHRLAFLLQVFRSWRALGLSLMHS